MSSIFTTATWEAWRLYAFTHVTNGLEGGPTIATAKSPRHDLYTVFNTDVDFRIKCLKMRSERCFPLKPTSING